MKNLLRAAALAICAIFTVANVSAQVITAERASEIANQFFANGKQKSSAFRSTNSTLTQSIDSRAVTGESNDAPTFHILTGADGKGFVIVSGEEIENPIIGYSFDGTIDTNNLPVGFVDYITDIDAQVKALRKYNAENPQKAAAARSAMQKTNYNATAMGDKVYLETASWGQDYPFNAQCFTSYNGSTNALTGCVPTAYAIIMRYHEWPQVGIGTLYNCQAPTYVEITDRTYDYSKMPLVYDGNWSTEQINEVAKLMSHLGHSFMVTYGSSQTSVSDPSNTDKPNKYFNYNLVYASYQANFTMDSWEEKIKESIDNGCPIPYASDNAGTGDTRHMFVLDGYTANDYFHFNFGWKGNSNGWFKLDAITPSQGDNYSWQDGADHYAIFNFTPNKTKYAVNASVSPENAGTVSINGSAAASSATGEYIEGLSVTLAATANTDYTFSNWTKGGEVVSTNKSCTVKVASSDNDYVANFLTVGNTTVNVSVTYNSSYGTVTGTSGTVANGTTLTPRLNEEVTLTATPLDGYVFNGWTVTKGTESTNYSGTSLTFVATGVMSVTANFALAETDYIIDNTTGTTLTTSRVNYWEHNAIELTLSTDDGGIAYNGYISLFAGASGSETYTLTAPTGYTITKYKFSQCRSQSTSSTYNLCIVADAEYPLTTSEQDITISNVNAATAQFTVKGDAGRSMYTEQIIVTLKKDGAGSGSTPPPTQYTITATSDPGTAGSVTGGGTYNEGANVTLTATPNSGYEFVNWTKGGIEVSTNATYSFTANASASYVANFQATAQTTFAVTTAANPTAGGTATFAEGTGQATTSATVASGTEVTLTAEANDGYIFVNWTLDGNVVSTDATCNVTVSQAANYVANFEEEAQAGTFPDGAYKIYWQADNRGYLAYHATDYPSEAKLAGVTYSGCQNIHYAVDQVDLVWYLITADDGKRYLFQAATGKFLGVDTSIQANGTGNKLSTTEAWPIAIEENTQHTGHYIITTEIDATNSLLCSGCGTPKEEHPVRWLTVNDTNQTDGGAPLQLIPVNDVTVADNVMNAVLAVINGTDEPEQQTLNVTYSGATWNNEASSWWVSVVTNTTPAVTVKTTDGTPKIGYSTFNEVRHPYLLDGNSFTISVPANCKITGYRLGYKAHNLVSKSVTYTNGKQSTGTITIAQSDEENTLTVTGLDNNEISFSVEDQSSQAGFIIKSLEITYVENEFEPAMFKAEIEGWSNDNPNTHLGTITIGGTAMKLTPAQQTASELTMPVVEGTALAFTRKYRGFEFNGFYIGSTELGTNPTLTAENVAAIDENNPLIAKFTATDDVTLFYDDDEFSYRIPAIAKTGNGMLVAVSDYRHNLDDIGRDNHGTGTKRVDLVMRTSTDNGATWSETKTIAAGDNNLVGSYQRAYGDAAIAAVGQNIVVMAAAGDVVYTAGTTSSPNKMARIYSTDNGATWTIEEMTTKMYSQSTSLIPSGGSAFFGSGKLAVDPNFNGTGNARIYGALLVRIGTDGYNNFGVFSDDLGATWKILGGDNTNPVAKGDEPKVEILPNGQILLSARRGGGRVFRVFTYGDDKANGAGSWGDAAVNGCDNGGSNATNGEIICLDAKRPNGKPTKILLQSQPKGGSGQYDRRDVTIWYKEVSADETYTSATIASDWTMGKQVSTQLSAYSAMCLQANGEIALFFEEAPCYGDDYTKGYSMVYIPLTIEEITNDNFLNPNADVEYVPTEFSIVLTDAQDNEYRETLDYIPGDVAAVESYLTTTYPFITLGTTGAIADNKYTNTVTLPFKVSNANTTVWHNIYWPANGSGQGQFYPIYMMANADNATNVAKITEQVHYGNSQYNTYNYADKLGWAVYNVNNSFTFKFKNKLTGKFMAVNGVVSSGNASNVIFTDETNATAFTLTKNTGTTYKGDFAITSVYNGTTGYVCNTSAGYADATNYTGNGHQGAWAKIVESPDYWTIYEKLLADIDNFGAGDGKYTENDAISSIDKDSLGTMLFSDLTAQATAVQNVKDSYTEITLTVPAVNDIVPGSVKIFDELVSHKFVPKGNVTIQAIPAAGYRFVNWTRPAAAASAAARTAEARNSDVVSTDNPYTVTVSEALSLEANFEQNVVNATLTDAEGNTYEVQVSGFTAEITKDAVEEKLREAYPYITLGSTDQEGNVIDFGVLNIDGTAYTYTNMVELPFRVTNTTYIWHNIYWPSNTRDYDYPVYLSASTADDIYVPKVTGSYAYGDHPTYNTKSGNNNISWAIYNVNNGFEFIFKNKVTLKYIKIINVADEDAQNVQYVENAEDATAFTIEMKPEGQTYYTDAKYALAAMFDETKGYLCSTSATGYNYATHYNSNSHQGAWIEFKEAPDYYSIIRDQGIILGIRFGAGDGKCIITDEISEINNAIANNSDNITFNTLKEYGSTMEEAMNNWPAVGLTINPAEGGTTNINGEENVVHKYVPNGYALPLAAVPAEGYHFVNWTGTDYESTDAATTITMSGNKGDVVEFTANFAKNSYTVNVSTNGPGGSAKIGTETSTTVEHGDEVTLTAEANDGYRFVNWTKGGIEVSTNATHNVTITEASDFVANFEEEATATEYPTPTGVTHTNNYLTSITTTGGDTNIDYSTNAHPGQSLVVVPGKVQLEKGKSFTMSLVAYSLGDGSSSVTREDMRYCHASLFTDFDQNFKFEASPVQTWGVNRPSGTNPYAGGNSHVYGNYDLVMNITHTITVPDDAPTGESRIRMIYTNAWKDWPANGTAELDKGIVYDIVVEVVEKVDITANAGEGGSVTINGEATGTKRVIKGSSVTLNATPASGYSFLNWSNTEGIVSETAEYTFTANSATTLTANFEQKVQDGLTTGYYHIVSRVTTSHEYLYNNALRTNNSKEFTLQSDSKITTNNGIWYITVNSNQLGVKNGDGNALVTGAAYCGNATTHNTLNIEKTTEVDDVIYYSFVEGINCTNRGQYNFTLEGGNSVQATDNNYVTTWAGNPDAQANQWRLERVDTDGKNIYNVVVECTEQDVYVVYGSGTNEEYAFNGGFFITDATITAQQLTAKKNNADAEGVTVLVEGNTIRVVDTEYVDITVSATPAEGGTVTINGEAESTLQVVKSSNVTVVATPADGYHFVNWTDAGSNAVSTDATYTFTASESTSLTANFEADVVYHTITVSTFYDNDGGTVKVGDENATSVNVAEGGSVRMLATVAEGYEFMGWLKDGVIVKNAIGGGLDFEVQGPDYTLYEIKASAEYVAVFSKITDYTNLEDGKAYRIRAVSESCATRYIYREGTVLKWTNDDSNFDDNSIFVVQKNGNSINLISAIGYHGWKASSQLGNDEQYNPYAAIKVTYGTKDDTRSLYLESGTSSGIYTTRPDNVFAFVYTPSKSSLPIMDADNSTTNFLFEEVDNYAFQVSAADGSNAKLGTINLPFATTVPVGVTAYGVDYTEGENVHMIPLMLTDNVLPANTPVLVEAEAAGKYGFKPAPASGDTYDTGFAGTLEAEDIPGTTNAYILSYKGVGTHIMLYKLSSTSRRINANKAYFIDNTGKASALRFVLGGTTDIEEVKGENGEVEAIYDLQGRKLSEITEPGMYIINGKKVYKK